MKSLQLVLIFYVYLFQLSYAHNVLLPAHGRRCFFEHLNRNDELSISFQFGDRNPQSLEQLSGDLVIYGVDHSEVLKFMNDVSHGEVTITANVDGKYEFCFLNENSGRTTKDVTFNLYGVLYVDSNDPTANTLDGAVRRLSKLTKDVKAEQSYIVIRERTHRNTAESTNDRVKWWSIFQLAVVVAQSLFQIYYLKRFFEVTSYV